MDILFWSAFIIIAVFFLFSSLTSFQEKEVRAGMALLISGIIVSAALLVPVLLAKDPTNMMMYELLSLGIFLVLFFFPTKRSHTGNDFTQLKRFHEADAVLSRRRLEPGSEAYISYYKEHPRFKEVDDRTRKNPGLLSPDSRYFDPLNFKAAHANFEAIESLYQFDQVRTSDHKQRIDKKHLSEFITNWMISTGAHSVGITELKDYHLYSHKGRGSRNGEEIKRDLSTAIVLTVEMDYQAMKYAPAGPTVKESSEQYLNSGILATKLALYIKELGYLAKAHIDGNYELICPLVAEDAGLGVIGRMGLLMTPRLGPRVRIAVVTTDIPLEYTHTKNRGYMLDFCTRCNKCVNACPIQAIPQGPKEVKDGVLRWRINAEKCYHFWTVSGTDCGRCVIVCPFSHPDNWFHQCIRLCIKNNLLFMRMAAKLDNLFYGHKPPVRPLPEWMSKMK